MATASSSCFEAAATAVTAASNACSLAVDGLRYPLTLRTYWSAAALISSSLAGTGPVRRVLMLRHMPKGYALPGPLLDEQLLERVDDAIRG